MKKSLLIAAIAVGTSGCKPLSKATENFSKGKMKGVTACLEVEASPLLSQEEVRDLCTKKHQHSVLSALYEIEGTAHLSGRKLGVKLHNLNDDIIITEVDYVVAFFDENGGKTTTIGSVQTWLLPGKEGEMSAPMHFEEDPNPDTPWCDHELEVSEMSTCKLWDIDNIYGIRF